MEQVLNIIKSKTLTYEQKVFSLAKCAENSINVLNIDEETLYYLSKGIICDLEEGNAPYRPRYITPDYKRFMEQGSEFLGIEPPTNIWEATNNLLMLYKHVPSITSYPAYIGNIDYLLEPFIEDEVEAYNAIKLFLIHIDRTITDSFCHGNIGPKYTKAGKIILKLQRELKTSVPNLTLRYNKEITSEELVIDAIKTSLIAAKPGFANDKMFSKEFSNNYCIASCYNGLFVGGGSYTLVRMNLSKLAREATDEDDFIKNILISAIESMLGYIDSRIRFLVDESKFFETNFLAQEGLIQKNKFTAMFGIIGLAECVNYILGAENLEDKFGHSKKANKLGYKIIEIIDQKVKKHNNSNCEITDNNFLLHAQVGKVFDTDASPGCRIPIGDEPELPAHLMQASRFHKYFPSGIGDIFTFDETAKNNPSYLLDIIDGAFLKGMRYISFYCSDCDVVRITGYLVKKSEMEKLDKGNQTLRHTVSLGLGNVKNNRVLDRRVRSIESSN